MTACQFSDSFDTQFVFECFEHLVVVCSQGFRLSLTLKVALSTYEMHAMLLLLKVIGNIILETHPFQNLFKHIINYFSTYKSCGRLFGSIDVIFFRVIEETRQIQQYEISLLTPLGITALVAGLFYIFAVSRSM